MKKIEEKIECDTTGKYVNMKEVLVQNPSLRIHKMHICYNSGIPGAAGVVDTWFQTLPRIFFPPFFSLLFVLHFKHEGSDV